MRSWWGNWTNETGWWGNWTNETGWWGNYSEHEHYNESQPTGIAGMCMGNDDSSTDVNCTATNQMLIAAAAT
eukprot:COSAG03_NODE_10945_length_620_cov_0.859885_1_plen_71_part_10